MSVECMYVYVCMKWMMVEEKKVWVWVYVYVVMFFLCIFLVIYE